MRSPDYVGCLRALGVLTLIGVGGLTLALVGCSFLIGTVTDAVLPGYNRFAPSTSMEPYDIFLRGEYKLYDSQVHKLEWHLRVPRAFVQREIGRNGAIYRTQDPERSEYFVSLHFIDDPSVGGSKPPPISSQRDYSHDVLIDLSNQALFAPAQYNCEKTKLYGWCVPDLKLCGVDSEYRGRSIQLHVTPAIYMGDTVTLKSTCDHMISEIDKYTVSIDPTPPVAFHD